MAIVVGDAATNHRVNPIPIGLRLRKQLEHNHPRAFAAHIAIRRRIIGLTMSIRRHHFPLRKANREIRVEDHIDTTGHRHGTGP